MLKIKASVKTRRTYYFQLLLRLKWEIKRLLDFSKKVKVEEISVVVVGRNDNYGGDFSKRLKTTITWNLKHLPNPELIYIEWNQIKDKPSDCTWITESFSNTKCYIVPEEIHKELVQNNKIPVMEYFGKNLGIRKATKEWILVINADVYIDPDNFSNLKLSRNFVYGTYFANVNWDGNLITKNNYKSFTKSVHHPTKTLGSLVGNFILTHKNNWLKSTGYDESLTKTRIGVDNDGLFQLESFGLKPMIMGTHYHLDHSESSGKGFNVTHGDTSLLKNRKYPYINNEIWGLNNYPLKKIAKNIWELQKI